MGLRRVRKDWVTFTFSFSISLSNEYSGLISLKIDWFDLLDVQGTFRSLLQHQSSKASILWCSAFFMVKFSQPYVITGKTIALTIQTFVSRVMSLFFNILGLTLLSCWEAIIFELVASVTIHSDFRAQEEEVCHYVHLFPFYLPWSNGASCHDISFFLILFLNWLFYSLPSSSSRGSLVPLHFLPLEWYHPCIWGWWHFSHLSWFQLVTHPAGISHDVLRV